MQEISNLGRVELLPALEKVKATGIAVNVAGKILTTTALP